MSRGQRPPGIALVHGRASTGAPHSRIAHVHFLLHVQQLWGLADGWRKAGGVACLRPWGHRSCIGEGVCSGKTSAESRELIDADRLKLHACNESTAGIQAGVTVVPHGFTHLLEPHAAGGVVAVTAATACGAVCQLPFNRPCTPATSPPPMKACQAADSGLALPCQPYPSGRNLPGPAVSQTCGKAQSCSARRQRVASRHTPAPPRSTA